MRRPFFSCLPACAFRRGFTAQELLSQQIFQRIAEALHGFSGPLRDPFDTDSERLREPRAEARENHFAYRELRIAQITVEYEMQRDVTVVRLQRGDGGAGWNRHEGIERIASVRELQ